MNLILCTSSKDITNDVKNVKRIKRIKLVPKSLPISSESVTLSDNKTILMKTKAETMNHSDGGGGDMDDLSDDSSSPESDNFDDSDLLSSTAQDEVTAQLAAAGKLIVSIYFKFINQLILIRSSWNCCRCCYCNG